MDLQHCATLITGGSRGLGAALGRELGGRGARVVLVARGRGELDAVVENIRAAGGEAYGLVADVGQADAVHPLVGSATALVGPLDLVVHNASTLGVLPLCELLESESDDVLRVLQVNLLGPFRLTKAVAGSMVLRNRGLVLSVSSDAAVVGYPLWGGYSVSKAALDHLMRIWAAELRETGVRFLSVDPGEMDTRMHADAVPGADRSKLASVNEVALRLAHLVETSESWPSGSRLDVARLGNAA